MLNNPRNSPLDKTNFQLFDPFRRSININNNLEKSRKQSSQSYDDSEVEDEEIEFGLLKSELGDDDDSGIHSPPLWKNNYSSIPLSPMARRQAIISGQRELMDMVKNIPESCYELSLKDLVQNQEQYLLKNDEQDYDNHDEEEEQEDEQVMVGQVQSNNNKQGNSTSKRREIKRAYSVDNNKGLFLKMVFPVGNNSTNSKSKKKNIVVLNSSSSSKGTNGKTSKSAEKYWWKKRFSISSESNSSSSRSSSRSNTSGSISSSSSRGSTITRERRSMLTSCMTCFHSSKNGSAE